MHRMLMKRVIHGQCLGNFWFVLSMATILPVQLFMDENYAPSSLRQPCVDRKGAKMRKMPEIDGDIIGESTRYFGHECVVAVIRNSSVPLNIDNENLY
ncbi:hypothetical protein BPOR_0353g00050 [Botrytis porri]|uniref:Uncharacterized protein n=1 Tax=Botrytis porri TaxID=87229 RepID=A0A4Z1KIJ5_9HELO|nr:hypothetical protein BPOR_0353g00050 [Botrytis porri]